MPHISNYRSRREEEESANFQGEKSNVMGELSSRFKKSSIGDQKSSNSKDSFPPPPPVFQTYAAQLSGLNTDNQDFSTSNKTENCPFPTKVTKVSINNKNSNIKGPGEPYSERKNSQDNGSPRKYAHKKCSSCSEPVIMGGGYANGQLFHQDCFKCENCNAKLEGKFFTKEKKPYCQDCFKVYEKHCEICGKSILTDCVESNHKFYHSHCMKCSECSQPLDGAYFILMDKFLCEKDYKKNKKSCSDCGQPIDGVYYTGVDNSVLCETHYRKRQGNCKRCRKFLEGNILKLPSGSYHADCFTCKVCQKNLGGQPISVDDNEEIYCSEDYDRIFALKCGSCKKPIVPVGDETTAPRLRAMGKDFHPHCFKCDTCGLILEDGCYPLDKKPFCMECFEERLNNC